jgi:WD40 repeat protein
VRRARFSPDGRRLVTTAWSTTSQDSPSEARVWDAATGQPVSLPFPHGAGVTDAAFSPDGRRLATACADGTARIWDLAPDDRPLPDLLRLVQLLSAHRIDATGGPVPLERAAAANALARVPGAEPPVYTGGTPLKRAGVVGR